jgi:hypothetical protein
MGKIITISKASCKRGLAGGRGHFFSLNQAEPMNQGPRPTFKTHRRFSQLAKLKFKQNRGLMDGGPVKIDSAAGMA